MERHPLRRCRVEPGLRGCTENPRGLKPAARYRRVGTATADPVFVCHVLRDASAYPHWNSARANACAPSFATGEGWGKDKIVGPSPGLSVPHPGFARMGHPLLLARLLQTIQRRVIQTANQSPARYADQGNYWSIAMEVSTNGCYSVP